MAPLCLDSVNLEIEFSETLDSTSALNISNYSINNGINILGVHNSTNPNKLIINTTAHTSGQQYAITVNTVSDLVRKYDIFKSQYCRIYYVCEQMLMMKRYQQNFYFYKIIQIHLIQVQQSAGRSPVGSHQTLKVYDILGNEVATLVDEYGVAGSYEVEFNTSSATSELASGVYVYRLQSSDFTETRKMVLLR